ncbi:hypothetical protein Bhyg_12009 [Pseudolycoriella hygida]|uniref:Uncharacterized protein n=1 Tax=Pseudolycoriella hygida TaxID=35572 RepID=A0A9Q0MWG1_9DIPT|nr:hypothetical protein Bhyg_12009 [Pseudolycoriella hygida]
MISSLAIFWPTREQNAAKTPKCFKPDFEDCRAIFDCTET